MNRDNSQDYILMAMFSTKCGQEKRRREGVNLQKNSLDKCTIEPIFIIIVKSSK